MRYSVGRLVRGQVARVVRSCESNGESVAHASQSVGWPVVLADRLTGQSVMSSGRLHDSVTWMAGTGCRGQLLALV